MSYLEDKYYEEHKYCPICGGEHYRMTLKGFIFNESHPEKFKDDNFIECIECGYKGIKHDCIANPEDCEHAKSMKDSSWEDIVTDEMIHEYASKQSHDCTMSFDIKMRYQMSVEDFVHYIVRNRPEEFGYFDIIKDDYNVEENFQNKTRYKYKHGWVLGDIEEELSNKKVKFAQASGGYGIMDYLIFV